MKIKIDKSFDLKMIEDYDRKLGIPKWYRGLSDTQTKAERRITNALRDDAEQGTTHRVRECLKYLGLHPAVPCKTLTILLKLCRGNDLAFLYFLLEYFYKIPNNERNEISYYTDNEQIIMTAVYHLDMSSTLMELEKILPPGHPSKAELKKRERYAKQKLRENCKKEREQANNFKNLISCSKSPYFVKQPMPRKYGKELNIQRPAFKTNFIHIRQFKDPHYLIPTKTTNWFGNYQLQPEKMTAKTIINECSIHAFEKHEHKLECLTAHKCEEYLLVAEVENILQCRFKLITQDICLRTLKNGSAQWRAQFDLLIWRLLQDIRNYLKVYDITRVKRNNASIQVINPNGTSLYFVTPMEVKQYLYMYKSLYLDFRKKKTCPGEIDEEFTDIDFSVEPLIINLIRDDTCEVAIEAPKKKVKTCLKNITIDCTDCISKRKQNSCHIAGRVTHMNQNMNGRGDEFQHPNLSNISLKAGEIYFRAPSTNEPCIFDYRKIFKNSSNVDDDFKMIKKLFVAALNKNTEKPYFYNDELANHPNLAEAAENCLLNSFTKNALEIAAENKVNRHPISPLFNGDFFDCEDEDLMRNMLKDAFTYLKKNPKFVLATLPDAHMLPIFTEFIKLRYGKTYTRKELKVILNESCRIYECLIRVLYTGPSCLPKVTGLPPNKIIEYKYKDCLVHTSKKILSTVHNKLIALWLDRLRIFWYASNPYYATYINAKNIFFSYTPYKYSDIRFFRIWRNCEYREMATYSLRRQIQNSKNSNLLK